MFSSMSCMSCTHSFLRSFKMAGVRGKNQSVQTSVCHLVFCQTEPVSWLWNSVMFDSNKPDCHRGHWYSPGKLREMHRIVISLCLALGLQLNVECQCFFLFCVCVYAQASKDTPSARATQLGPQTLVNLFNSPLYSDVIFMVQGGRCC